MSTGFPEADAKAVFARERRRQALSSIASRLRHEPDDVSVMLPFEEVVAALGRRSQRDLGVQRIPLASIVGTVDRRPETFDRAFRPRSPEVRARWERIAAARRRGEPMPPIDVYRVGDIHFVVDGHHRVSVARALGETTIDAHVREVSTEVGATPELKLGDLELKHHERMFHQRVPLPAAMRARIQLGDEWRYARLADYVEAWGFRVSLGTGRLLSRREAAERWFREGSDAIVRVLNEPAIGGSGTETERYFRVAMLRYLLLHTHEWSDEVVERLVGEVRRPAAGDDTLVHKILDEMS